MDSMTWLREFATGKYITFIIPLGTSGVASALELAPNVIYDIGEIGADRLLDGIPFDYCGNVTNGNRGAYRYPVHNIVHGHIILNGMDNIPEFVLYDFHKNHFGTERHDIVLFFPCIPSVSIIDGDIVARSRLSDFLNEAHADTRTIISDSVLSLLDCF